MWGEAASSQIYLQNFVPLSRHPDEVPAELWTGKRQDVSHLRPLGCNAWAKIPKEKGESKLSPRSIQGKLIGYMGHRGYRTYIPATHKIIESRDVIFEEGLGHWSLPKMDKQNDIPATPIFKESEKENCGHVPDTPDDSEDNGNDPDDQTPVKNPDRDEQDVPANEQDIEDPGFIPPDVVEGEEEAVHDEPVTLRRSNRTKRETTAIQQSRESEREVQIVKNQGIDWATNRKNPNRRPWVGIVFMVDPWAFLSFNDDVYIPQSFKEAME